ncbi:hypothetical protein GCM10025759_32680 [Lysobacter panacisoli]|uniref:Uncharacterized protein n=1 Tax=Lysobacter panacisoli TaxID=1255263 RepID=A0ABP9LRW0_9GAMM
MVSLKRIRESSAEIRRLNERIGQTVLTRSNSPAEREAWERACAEFHQRFDSLAFPGGHEVLDRIRADDPSAVEAAVSFLVADPYHFRSGYLKEYLWRWLPHCSLTSSARTRLEHAALKYLDRRISREFWNMCKAMALLGRSEFWATVCAKSQIVGTPEAFRAVCLLTYGADVHAGARLRRSIYHGWMTRKPA